MGRMFIVRLVAIFCCLLYLPVQAGLLDRLDTSFRNHGAMAGFEGGHKERIWQVCDRALYDTSAQHDTARGQVSSLSLDALEVLVNQVDVGGAMHGFTESHKVYLFESIGGKPLRAGYIGKLLGHFNYGGKFHHFTEDHKIRLISVLDEEMPYLSAINHPESCDFLSAFLEGIQPAGMSDDNVMRRFHVLSQRPLGGLIYASYAALRKRDGFFERLSVFDKPLSIQVDPLAFETYARMSKIVFSLLPSIKGTLPHSTQRSSNNLQSFVQAPVADDESTDTESYVDEQADEAQSPLSTLPHDERGNNIQRLILDSSDVASETENATFARPSTPFWGF